MCKTLDTKIYCCDCKYYKYRPCMDYRPVPPNICMRLTERFRNGVGEVILRSLVDCLKQNKNHNCVYFKRIWWKFWRKWIMSNILKKKITSSSTISEVQYNTTTKTLTISFLSGSGYDYFKVPHTIYLGLINAGSVGKYFWRRVRNKYVTKKVR